MLLRSTYFKSRILILLLLGFILQNLEVSIKNRKTNTKIGELYMS
jgi:hypothetical protein